MSKVLFALSKKRYSEIDILFYVVGAVFLTVVFKSSYDAIVNALLSLAYFGFVCVGSYLTGFVNALAVDVAKKRHVRKQCEKLAKAVDDRKGDL